MCQPTDFANSASARHTAMQPQLTPPKDPGLIVACPECQSSLRVGSTIDAGRRVRCPKCKREFAPIEPANDSTNDDLGVGSPRIFISHSHEDGQYVERTLKPLLKRHGLDPWGFSS